MGYTRQSSEEEEDDKDDSSSDDDEEAEEAPKKSADEPVSKKRSADDMEIETPVKKARTQESDKSATLFVGNLSWNIDDNALYEAFESCSGITGARVITDKANSRSRGFGYVDFATPEDAEKAMNEKNGSLLDNRDMRLDFSGKPAETPNGRASDRAQRFGDTVSPESDTLFVGNLSFHCDEDMVSALFSEVAEVKSLRLPTDP
jgi:nucleolin